MLSCVTIELIKQQALYTTWLRDAGVVTRQFEAALRCLDSKLRYLSGTLVVPAYGVHSASGATAVGRTLCSLGAATLFMYAAWGLALYGPQRPHRISKSGHLAYNSQC